MVDAKLLFEMMFCSVLLCLSQNLHTHQVGEGGKQAPCAQFRLLKTLDEMDVIKDELWACTSRAQIPLVHNRHKSTKNALRDLLTASRSAITRLDSSVKKLRDAGKRKAGAVAGRGGTASSASKRAKKDLDSAFAMASEICVSIELNAGVAKPVLIRFDAKNLSTMAEDPSDREPVGGV